MILTLEIKLAWAPSEWKIVLEVDGNMTLDELHLAIQHSIDFDNDHLYHFYVARTYHSREQEVFDDENGELYNKKIADVFPLPDKHKFFYLFDYGDSWKFQISKSRKAPQPAVAGVSYPRVVAESGERPKQYSDYDEE